MRIITGDECGLLKEVIPELCRPLNDDPNSSARGRHNASAPLGYGSSSNSAYSAIHAGKARPSATSIQAAASSYGNYSNSDGVGGPLSAESAQQRAVRRLETEAEAQSRERGIVSLAFLPRDLDNNNDNNTDDDGTFNFAALRMNGSVETWSANRQTSGYSNEKEVNVTAATYRKYGGLTKSILSQKDEEDENAVSSSNISDNDDEDGDQNNSSTSSKGWYTQQPIRPIGMVSTNNKTNNPILATCDSIGNISLVNAHNMSAGIVAQYNAFDFDADSLVQPSSSKNSGAGAGVLTYTKGGFANSNIATSLALCGGGE
eukprot:CAMPEP_0201911094 /NCGR_PEP_ID=MMETSP0903-20130614/2185_1 /ASSEMBLY_ACC=CAM_ASM_000552 /TAXON_ID=420261 /ORGANISM="Thalassiosira antarctica, Strain CCMP982" /LENGTH=316 /DNA_ID=CAMNT_0048445781 /DNA_START=78 /DNA_END=1025 /DNA_ORIENTATION=-